VSGYREFQAQTNGDMRGAMHAVAEKYQETPTALDEHKLSTVVAMLDDNLVRACMLGLRLRKAMDYICGPTPQVAPIKDAAPAPEATLDIIAFKQRLLFDALDVIDAESRRLERVVG
jgi:hypothetical protein